MQFVIATHWLSVEPHLQLHQQQTARHRPYKHILCDMPTLPTGSDTRFSSRQHNCFNLRSTCFQLAFQLASQLAFQPCRCRRGDQRDSALMHHLLGTGLHASDRPLRGQLHHCCAATQCWGGFSVQRGRWTSLPCCLTIGSCRPQVSKGPRCETLLW